ncbi:MAG: hypothetical protein LBK46_01605 [Oscillospiraceae bacterium]|jgi:hypothetical protein|nr:hypothetical protein [Oscillospiraceae bacterium]
MNRGVNRFIATLWRWALIVLVYLVLGVPLLGLVLPGAGGQAVEIPMLFQSLLRSAANNYGFFPDHTYYESWQRYCSLYAMNCLYISLALTGLWNVIYATPLLGRNHERSALGTFWLFVFTHAALMLGYAFVHFTIDSLTWDWLIRQPGSRGAMLLLPQWLALPFAISIRLLCPYRVYPMFPIADKIRAPLGLRVYSRRGAR